MTCNQSLLKSLPTDVQEKVQKWDLHNPHCLLILQDEVREESSGGILLAAQSRKKEQTAVGEALVIKLHDDPENPNPLYLLLNLGDKVKFAPGTQINGGMGHARVQLLHIDNVMARLPAS